jgi:hypothetical protein
MSARDDLIYRITRHCSAETAEQLADAYRAEVLAKAIGRLRAIPVDCTALTGPVWYGDGWNSAITCLEGIADYQTPDDEAYPGELQRLRALALGLRVAALRKDDLAEAQRLLVVHAEHEMNVREKASVAAPTATPADTSRRARLLHEMDLGGRWKSGDVVRWYQTQGLTGFDVRAARHDLATLRDSGAITQHDTAGLRFYTRASRPTRKDHT